MIDIPFEEALFLRWKMRYFVGLQDDIADLHCLVQLRGIPGPGQRTLRIRVSTVEGFVVQSLVDVLFHTGATLRKSELTTASVR